MVGKNIIFSNDARKRMLDGMIRLEKAVLTTLGPKGKCVLIDKNNTMTTTADSIISTANKNQSNADTLQGIINRFK